MATAHASAELSNNRNFCCYLACYQVWCPKDQGFSRKRWMKQSRSPSLLVMAPEHRYKKLYSATLYILSYSTALWFVSFRSFLQNTVSHRLNGVRTIWERRRISRRILRTQTYFRLSLVPPKTTDSRKYVCVRRLDETRLRTWYVLQFYSFFYALKNTMYVFVFEAPSSFMK